MRLEFFAWETLGMFEMDIAGLATFLKSTSDIDRYRADGGADYERPQSPRGDNTGMTTIPILEFLWGLPLSNLILAYLPQFKPSKIVISTGTTYCNSCGNRITIYVDANDIVTRIQQEVTVLYGCGADIDSVRRSVVTGEPVSALGSMVGNAKVIKNADFS